MKDQKKSILEMARGAILERVDEEVKRVIVNIMDNETLASAKRKVVVTVEFKPDALRQNIQVKATAKSTLAPKKVETNLVVESDFGGEVQVLEMQPQIPGQTAMEESGLNVLRLEREDAE